MTGPLVQVAHRVRCTGGSCRQETRWHYALWPALRGGHPFRSGGCIALPVRNPKPYFYSAHAGAQVVHHTRRGATVWEGTTLRIVGAKALCNAESCLAIMSTTPHVEGLRPCLRCAQALERNTTR